MNDMNWVAVYPELLLLALACVVALVDLFVTDARRTTTYWLTQLSLAVVGVMHFAAMGDGPPRRCRACWSSTRSATC